MKPILSMCCIMGDAHVRLLPRMVKSLVNRPGGPACDEIVIGWNGKDDTALWESLQELGGSTWTSSLLLIHLPIEWTHEGVHYYLFRQEWKRNFARARQETFERATGIWRGYIDLDDELALPDDPLLAETTVAPVGVNAASETPIKPTRLQDYLMSRRPGTNLILAPYYFAMSPKRQALTIIRRPRIVKWEPGWAWKGEVHEELRHVLGRESPVWNGGFLLVHSPILTLEERAERNVAIAQDKLLAEGVSTKDLPAPMAHGVAADLFDSRLYAQAIAEFESLIPTSGPEERLQYWGLAAAASLAMGDVLGAGRRALEMIALFPERPEGYIVACESAAVLKQWDYAVKWYEAGGSRDVPPGAMVDDRLRRLYQPVFSAATSYLNLGRPVEALAVISKAKKLIDDPYLQEVERAAQAQIREEDFRKAVTGLTKNLNGAGFPRLAQKVLRDLRPVLPEDLEDVAVDLDRRMASTQAVPVAADTIVRAWLDACSRRLDTLLDTGDERAWEKLIESIPEGAEFRVAAATVQGAPAHGALPIARTETITAEDLLQRCEAVGDVIDLMLVEEADGARLVAASTVKRASTARAPWRPDVTFFCPMYAESWGPWRITRNGTGGSEESVVYLAQEFARRGLNVQVVAPLDACHAGVHVENGVRWRPLTGHRYSRETPGISIACRAPHAVRMVTFDPARLYVWHQDAAYSAGTWSADIIRGTGHIFVSKWQRDVLASSVGVDPHELTRTIVAPDGIPDSALYKNDEARDPFACVYLSSPVRGLELLLDLWPEVQKTHPQATLHCFYGWHTAPRSTQGSQSRIMTKVSGTPGVIWRDRVPQSQLDSILPEMGTWLYPSCLFPEGYCISGVRAAAAGLAPVYVGSAALPETQYPGPWTVPEGEWEDIRSKFLDATREAITASVMGQVDRPALRQWAAERTWKHSADLILQRFDEDGLLPR